MKMREMFDEYLDGALDRAGRAEVERCIAAEPAAAGLLAELKAQRAARVGVYNSYVPSPAEASAFAHRVLQACADEAHAPVGHIRPNHHWIRWTAGVAAGLIIAAGAFSAGRMSVAPQVVDKPIVTEQTVYEVAVLDPRGNITASQQFNSAAERDAYVLRNLPANNSSALADVDIFPGGRF